MITIEGKYLFPSAGIILQGKLPAAVCVGQYWNMVIRIRPIHGQLNDAGFDSQRFLLAQHQALRGRIIDASLVDASCGIRARYISSVSQSINHYPWKSIILALAFGERISVNEEVKKLLRDTGTAHLMAISGLHISLAGSIGWGGARLLQIFLPAYRIGYRFPLFASVVFAIIYSWLAGMNPPALRTIVAMSTWFFLRISGRNWSAWQVWLCCVSAILFADPLNVLSDSFWLSVIAVAGLLFWYQWLPISLKSLRWYIRHPIALLHLQVGITLLLIPLQITIFRGISLTSILANLFAIPMITFISVPFILAGMLLNSVPVIGQYMWLLADRSLAAVFALLAALPEGWLNLDSRFQGVALIAWAGIIVWRFGLVFTSPALVTATITLLFFPFWRKETGTIWSLHMLDVGHGLALVIEKNKKAYLYDTGNAWPGGSAAKQIIIPWLSWHNLVPQEVVISHEHMDHRGGLPELLKTWPSLSVRSSLLLPGHKPCYKDVNWEWQGLKFMALWPPKESVPKGNNGSCVVMISDGRFNVLLTGDIETPAEKAMLSYRWSIFKADIIQVPHHGSKTSSSIALLNAVSGRIAISSGSRFNAWRLPSARVIQRYKKTGYEWYDTAKSGQITIRIAHDKWQVNRFRAQILPRWYHQWFGVDPDNR